jgi:hypothetical protein
MKYLAEATVTKEFIQNVDIDIDDYFRIEMIKEFVKKNSKLFTLDKPTTLSFSFKQIDWNSEFKNPYTPIEELYNQKVNICKINQIRMYEINVEVE